MHLPELAPGQVGLVLSGRRSRSPWHNFLTHTPQPHALGFPQQTVSRWREGASQSQESQSCFLSCRRARRSPEVYITKHSKASENSRGQSGARELFTETPFGSDRGYCQVLEGFYHFLLHPKETRKLAADVLHEISECLSSYL
ncbi:unnamed protein product [Rangifer tarandus platyrhynchus]|uniref:Uncharacterized protein n=1 Tax=Rangifer tarandus platyrhynchus TaxID=3082113 RepID=A0AC59YFJ9_RANTA